MSFYLDHKTSHASVPMLIQIQQSLEEKIQTPQNKVDSLRSGKKLNMLSATDKVLLKMFPHKIPHFDPNQAQNDESERSE